MGLGSVIAAGSEPGQVGGGNRPGADGARIPIERTPAVHHKVLLVNSLYFPHEGGAETAVRLLAQGLVERGLDVVVVCLSPAGREQRDVIDGIRVIRVPLANLYWPFGTSRPASAWRRALWHGIDAYNVVMGRRLGKIIDQERPDLIHLHNLAGFSVAAVSAAKSRGLPVVQTLHDYYWICPRSDTFRNGGNCARPCITCRAFTSARRRAASSVDAVCGVSNAVLCRVEQFGIAWTGARREIVYNLNLAAPAVALRQDKLPFERFKIGYIGRLHPTKGLETLIEAARRLGDLPIEVSIAGEGRPDYVAQLARRAEGLPVRFVGPTEPIGFFGSIDVLVVPSVWYEPFGRVVQEAFSCGVPVIGADRGGIPEAIGSDGTTGFTFPAGEPDHLSRIIRRLVRDGIPSGQFAEACLRRSRIFDADAVVPRQIEIYGELISRR